MGPVTFFFLAALVMPTFGFNLHLLNGCISFQKIRLFQLLPHKSVVNASVLLLCNHGDSPYKNRFNLLIVNFIILIDQV